MNNQDQINPLSDYPSDRAIGEQQTPDNNPVRDGYDQQPIDREEFPGRIDDPGTPSPDPTYEPRRPQVTSNTPGSGVFNGLENPDNVTEAGVEQNFENEALYGQDDYALYSQKLDEFDQRLTQNGSNLNDPDNFREQSASLRTRLEDAQRQGYDQWEKSKQGIQDSFTELEHSWSNRQGGGLGQQDLDDPSETNPY